MRFGGSYQDFSPRSGMILANGKELDLEEE